MASPRVFVEIPSGRDQVHILKVVGKEHTRKRRDKELYVRLLLGGAPRLELTLRACLKEIG